MVQYQQGCGFSGSSSVGTLRSNDANGNENVKKKNNRFCKQNNNFARASRFFVHFFARFCTTTTWKCPISLFMEDVNKRRRNFISLSVLGYGPKEFNSRRFAYIWQSKWIGIIAIKTERTQIHFLSDVLITVASLNLKVPSLRYHDGDGNENVA